MSNLNAIGLLAAMAVSGTFVSTYTTARAREAAADIVTGVIHGVPVSMTYRWLSLYNVWVNFISVALLLAAILGFACWQVGANVDDGNVRLLAYLCAGYSGIVFFGGSFRSVSQFSHHVALLRQADSDAPGT